MKNDTPNREYSRGMIFKNSLGVIGVGRIRLNPDEFATDKGVDTITQNFGIQFAMGWLGIGFGEDIRQTTP